MHDSVAMAQVIHDTIYIKGFENIDLINKVDGMYNNAFNRLMIFWYVLIAFILLVIGWWQRQQLRKSDEKMNQRIDEIKIMSLKSKGYLAHMQAESTRLQFQKYKEPTIDYIKATKYYLEANDLVNVNRSLEAAAYCITKLENSEVREITLREDIQEDLSVIYLGIPKTLSQKVHEIRTVFSEFH
jgi:hypothetical protein